jgi:hypothetical protein
MKPYFVRVRKVAKCTVLTIPAAIVRELGLKCPGVIAAVHLQENGTVTVTFYKEGVDGLLELRPLARFGEMLAQNRKTEKKI